MSVIRIELKDIRTIEDLSDTLDEDIMRNNIDERKLTIDWVGTEGSVKGNVSFTTDRNVNITLTASEIDALYKASIEAQQREDKA